MKQRLQGLILGRYHGGTVKCAACEQILGYIDEENLDYLYLHLVCRCGESGYLEWGTLPEEPQAALADAIDGNLSCPECGRGWFTVGEGCKGSAFRVCCSCGIFAEHRHERKRNLYRELIFPKN